MPCATCQESTQAKREAKAADAALPLLATDIQVVDHNEIRAFAAADWPADKHKLLIFYPEVQTPVCSTELGALNKWVQQFAELDCVIIAACTDNAHAIKDWYEAEPSLSDLACLTFSTYLLPARLGLVEAGRAKRSSVFVMKDDTIVKQECFHKVGRSFNELHRQLYAYTTGDYCGAEWQSPSDSITA